VLAPNPLDEAHPDEAQGKGMALVLIALVVLLYVIIRGQGRPVLTKGHWRTGAGLLAIGSFAAAAFLAVRTDWPEAAAMLTIACALLLGARSRGIEPPKLSPRPKAPRKSEPLTTAEARKILGVTEGATARQIREAYTRLMRTAHPDHGGSHGLAAQLNAARDRLLGKRAGV
jgi:hypothetical protein